MFRYSRHEIRLGELFQANQIRIAEEEGSSRFRHRKCSPAASLTLAGLSLSTMSPIKRATLAPT